LSRANSSRAPSFVSATLESNKPHGYPLPPTPTTSARDEGFDDFNGAFIDGHKRLSEHQEEAEDQAKPTTPLLPPIMTELPGHADIPYQSPLQSPTVADPDAPSVLNSPLPTPRIAGLPSPPLSNKPSTASFQRQRGCTPVIPSSEIPPLAITESDDLWAQELGHANFTIHPEPYEPVEPDVEACRQLRANWEAARYNFAKHLMRTGDNHGTTSKTYHLTEEKWAEIDSIWKRNTEACIAYVSASGPESVTSLSQSEVIAEPPPLIKMPSLNGPKSEGKFPVLGDEGIVGPMEVVASPLLLQQQAQQQQQPPRKKRKLGFFRWMQGVWPAGVGVFGRGTSSGP